ncbi:MAG: DUF3422 domain-containing protein, partial [Brevundimonas sp.]|nr:DUF3422 domain-containing protein [Brevundimonas sp.]
MGQTKDLPKPVLREARMALLMHPLRQRIVSEMHLRRMPALRPPCQLMQVVRLVSEAERSEESSWLLSLAERDGTVGGVFPRHARGTTSDGGTWLWERHSEASTCTILTSVADASTFSPAAFPEALVTWLEQAPGLVIRAVKLLVAVDDDAVDPGSLSLDPDDLISCRHNNARLWSDFQVHEDGWGRLVVAA